MFTTILTALTIWYLIGVAVSAYFIWYYRFSSKKGAAKQSDSIGALIGPWVWPLQILQHLTRSK